jgi:hypothetical protein
MFRVPDHEWKRFIPEGSRHLMLCRPCWDTIVGGALALFPPLCARCGKVDPEPFQVHTVTWNDYVEPMKRKSHLCRPCFDAIKGLIDAERAR